MLVTIKLGKGVTRALSWMHGKEGVMTFIFCVLTAAARGLLMKGPWKNESLCFCFFTIAQVSFIALFASPDLSLDVSRVMAIHQLAYVIEDLVKGDKSAVRSSLVSCMVCFVVMFFRLALLKFDKDEDLTEELDELRDVKKAKKEGLWMI
ncbi:hypothetical protein POM88_024450 [Heracleum sosnowskyi]|uniref:Uncharacterized protein n=1 Tax=Heracleum sosnowskyi TaxID=360622 RepID=A0AAD8I2E3_9APIA|nr:hypothetical protein POM88_024450 [Heracleum sosnowskyi]